MTRPRSTSIAAMRWIGACVSVIAFPKLCPMAESGCRQMLGIAQVRGQTFAHEVDKVLTVEAVNGLRSRTAERVVEALERVPSAFNLRVVGGEERDALVRILDDPTDILMGVWGHPHLPFHELGGFHRELLQALLVL